MSNRFAPLFSTLSAPVTAFVRAALSLKTIWEGRRVVGQLGALDDYMLRDIGITRQDVLSVMAEPLFRDPSEKLAERAMEARQAARASVGAVWRGSDVAGGRSHRAA